MSIDFELVEAKGVIVNVEMGGKHYPETETKSAQVFNFLRSKTMGMKTDELAPMVYISDSNLRVEYHAGNILNIDLNKAKITVGIGRTGAGDLRYNRYWTILEVDTPDKQYAFLVKSLRLFQDIVNAYSGIWNLKNDFAFAMLPMNVNYRQLEEMLNTDASKKYEVLVAKNAYPEFLPNRFWIR